MTEERAIWERNKGESRKAYKAFSTYLDLGDTRSYVKVARELGKSKTQISKWGKRWGWVERAAEYDDYIEKEARREVNKEKIANRKARIAGQRLLLTKGITALRAADPLGKVEYEYDKSGRIKKVVVIREPWTVGEIIRAMQVSTVELRRDYDDEPARRITEDPRDEGYQTEIARALRQVTKENDELFEVWDRELEEEGEVQ